MSIFHLPVFILGVIIWNTLNHDFTINTFIESLVISTIISVLHSQEYRIVSKSLRIKPNYKIFNIVKYIIFLILSIIKSSTEIIRAIITGDLVPVIAKIETELQSPLNRVILSTTITLTPGTITISEQKKFITIISIKSKVPKKKNEGTGNFEKLLLESEVSK